jgi:TonB family protein
MVKRQRLNYLSPRCLTRTVFMLRVKRSSLRDAVPSLLRTVALGFVPLILNAFQGGPATPEAPRLAGIAPPRLIATRNMSPAYPDEAKQRGVSGYVTLDLRVDDAGDVATVKVTKPLDPKLDELAVNAVSVRQYQPARFGGRTFSMTVQAAIPFLDGAVLGGILGASSPPFNAPTGLAVNRSGDIFVADAGRSLIYKVSSNGTMMTIFAGDGSDGFRGDGGSALSAELNVPYDLAIDDAGNLFVADTGNSRVRKITPGGIISTVAGNGIEGWSGDGGSASAAQLNKPLGIAVDSSGVLYIADTGNSRIRSVSNGIIRTIAGTGTEGSSGDEGPAVSAQLGTPYDIAVDPSGNLYVADARNGRVRKIDSKGIVTTVIRADSQTAGGSALAIKELVVPLGVAVDSAGILYITDGGSTRVRKVQSGNAVVINWNAATTSIPTRVTADDRGNIYVADGSNGFVRRITSTGAIFSVPR